VSAGQDRVVPVGDLNVSCRTEGPADAPVVLLVHGVLTDHRAWNGVAERLAASWRVVRYDLRGHGHSSAPPAPYTMEQLADDAAALLDALDIAKAHFIGTSLGGMIGQQFGARHGDRLLSLTLANTSAVQPAPQAWLDRAAQARAAGSTAPLAEGTLQRWFTPGFHASAPGEIERMRAILQKTSVAGFEGCAQALSQLAQLPLLPRIAVPTLVVVGSEDQATPPAQGRQIRDAIPGAKLAEVPAAHQAAVEQPQAFVDAWLAFAKALPR
jgi:3-oxoadipate enol-lactonase